MCSENDGRCHAGVIYVTKITSDYTGLTSECANHFLSRDSIVIFIHRWYFDTATEPKTNVLLRMSRFLRASQFQNLAETIANSYDTFE
jgi:hypothetical protein